MLISGHNLTVKKNVELTREQTQFLIDFEAGMTGLGLYLYLTCPACASIGDLALCSGNADLSGPHPKFEVDCRCTHRAYTGDDLVAPELPRPLIPRQLYAVRPEVELTRDQMRLFDHADQLLRQLKLQYHLRCMRCRDQNEETDGVWGAKASTQNEFHADCACTVRVYRGADAPATGH